ncbi:hypothetical protein Droror1_Dr00001694 [Drosera rotundifolia]
MPSTDVMRNWRGLLETPPTSQRIYFGDGLLPTPTIPQMFRALPDHVDASKKRKNYTTKIVYNVSRTSKDDWWRKEPRKACDDSTPTSSSFNKFYAGVSALSTSPLPSSLPFPTSLLRNTKSSSGSSSDLSDLGHEDSTSDSSEGVSQV